MSDPYEGEVPACSLSGRPLVDRVLRRFMVELRAVLDRVGPAYRLRNPKARGPCHTCAFNQATDGMKGWDSTAAHLQRAIEHGNPFLCHKGIPWMKPEMTSEDYARILRDINAGKVRPCASYAAIAAEPDIKTAFERAAATVVGGKA